MLKRWTTPLLMGALLVAQPTAVLAGMPAPLPTDVSKILILNGTALERLQAISFFLLAFLLSAGLFQLVWKVTLASGD